ncbi:serine hydrolase [Natronobiforma cellulositropha]
MAALVCIVLVLQAFTPLALAAEPTALEQSGASAPPAFDDEAASAFDALVEEAMADYEIAGASASVVEGGELVHAAGYGYADADTGEAVDPDETLFRVGSVAKLPIWTAIVQGTEDGTLSLEDEVGDHVDGFEAEGVTLEHLGTHSAGYEDRLEGLFVREYEEAADWEAKLEREMPRQVRPAGETIAYSNHGSALAGLVVQEANGEPYERYLEREVFEPLEMTHTTFDQPVPDEVGTVSKGHVPLGDGYHTDEYVVVGVPPAGSMSASATDMANFMSATLEGGAFGDERILESASVDAMLEERASHHPSLNGVGYGYMQMDRGGERIVGHTGGTEYFHTLLALFPEHDTGVFVSFNSPGGTAALVDVLDGFVEDHLGGSVGPDETLETHPGFEERADAYEGEYRTTRFVTTHEKLAGLGETITVSATDDGLLETSFLGGGAVTWVEIEPGVFAPGPDNDLFVSGLVIEDDRLYLDAPSPPYERLSWYERTSVQGGLFALALLAIVSPLFVWPVNAYRTRGDGRLRDFFTRARVAVLACSLLAVVYLGAVVGTLLVDPLQFIYGLTLPLRIALGLALVLTVATVVAAVTTALELTGSHTASRHSRLARVYLVVVLLAFATLLWQLEYWNVLRAAL